MRLQAAFLVFLVATAEPAFAGTICGHVRDTGSSQPVAHAGVLVFDAQGHYTGLHAVTDLNGSYCIDNVPNGTYTVQVNVDDYAVKVITGVVVDGATGVDIETTPRYFLAQPAPNPASSVVAFRLVAPRGEVATLEVFDVHGRLVKAWSGETSGESQVQWDLRDPRGDPIASGVYLVRLRAGGEARTQRFVCVR